MKIYLAGKIGTWGDPNWDWRLDILPVLKSGDFIDISNKLFNEKSQQNLYAKTKWPILERAIFGEHDYTGPYFMAAGMHNCRDENHMFGMWTKHDWQMFELQSSGQQIREINLHQAQLVRDRILALCLEAINVSDLLFAWLEDAPTFYTADMVPHGTLVEIGYAKGKNKQVVIGMPKHLHRHDSPAWFVHTIADRIVYGKTPKEALKYALKPRIDYHEYILSESWREKADRAKERAGQRCQLCNRSGALHAHHRTYERLGEELDEDITVLCPDCHQIFHENRKVAS